MLDFYAFHNSLERTATDVAGQPLHARAFIAWIRPGNTDDLKAVTREAMSDQGPARRTEHVAALGYAIHGLQVPDDQFREDLTWLQERRFFSEGRPPQYEIDGLALLGTAIGILALEDGKARESALTWLQALLKTSLKATDSSDWNGALIRAASVIATADRKGEGVPADLRVALSRRGLFDDLPANRDAAWDLVFDLRCRQDGPTRSAVHLAVYDRVLKDAATVRLAGVVVEDVAKLLHGLRRALRRWTWEDMPRTQRSKAARWDVENEYHLQNLLWVVLAPVFPDLEDEENLPSLGHKHPRCDLGIPSLKLIIEAKFLRGRGQRAYAKVIDEVAADASLYLKPGSGYESIIAVVWDDLSQTQEHEELRQGLTRIRGVSDAVILARPGQMWAAAGDLSS